MKPLSSLLSESPLIQAMAAHSPLSARLAQEAGFDAIWASGFELSALYGLPDVSLTTMTEHLSMTRAMAAQVTCPVIADIDTGFGNAVNVDHAVREYERAGASAVVIEDKLFPKVTSLVEGGRQELLRTEEFQGKIEAACNARDNGCFKIIARTEALIAGQGVKEALRRGYAYAQAGADLLLVHSKSKTPDEIEAFIEGWTDPCPLVLVPTSYPEMTTERMSRSGKVAIAIWGNHAIRASVKAMQDCFARIRREGGILNVDAEIAPVNEVFRLQKMERVRMLEKSYLR
ncbi:isocitrate lyase/phosphoenolpyruvate mutase family protein [Roseibium aggregatum]|uniref:Isocitrate lyase/phosphoenolpyruvate mutase family protein n=1 Tax=Roseibium aggregatum TaxID=187304 RepID=A0A939J2W9_9HYPH|nr:isocitrate lyase/phosphoenolpyruvate mutase family protein [Roseibium aggregatum]MBN9669044.1 isocitrate lyase/phosphoenolpyruvate mutase family protein [Roseibium aggregatum]